LKDISFTSDGQRREWQTTRRRAPEIRERLQLLRFDRTADPAEVRALTHELKECNEALERLAQIG
jgi:hypothetical protein